MQSLINFFKKKYFKVPVFGWILLIILLIPLYFFYIKPTFIDLKPADILTQTPEEACRLTFSIKEKEMTGFNVSCSKEFINPETDTAFSDSDRFEPGDLVKVRVTLDNIGNSDFTDLSLKDPLNNLFFSNGAQNLNWVDFVEFSNSSGINANSLCTYSQNTRVIDCGGINLPINDQVNVDFVLRVNDNIESDQDVVNVAQAYMPGSSLEYFCNDSLKTTYISSVCNTETLSCEEVYRPASSDETTCTSSVDCGNTEVQTHLECVNEACVEVDGEGANTCSVDNDCAAPTHLVCQNEACVEAEGEGSNECSIDADCEEEQAVQEEPSTYLTCQNEACVEVEGEGSNECSINADCEEEPSTYLTCQDEACVEVEGDGENQCSINADCVKETHLECQNNSCVEADGPGSDKCSTDSDCSPEEIASTPEEPEPTFTEPEQNVAVPETGNGTLLYRFVIGLAVLAGFFLGYKLVRRVGG